jgi:DNA sulfur modification protein DndC
VIRRDQISMLTDEPLSLRQAMELTADSINAYGPRFQHWAAAYSGGKDSSAMATVLACLIEHDMIQRPKSLTYLYADTRMELPPLQSGAMSLLAEMRDRGFQTQVVLPPMQDRFMVYMLGRGVPPPKNRFRWCTGQLKVEPMERALVDLRDLTQEKILMMTGVRVGESAARDARIALSCGKDGAECGQGWFQETIPTHVADTLAPVLHWRVCHVWDWLAGSEGNPFHTGQIADVYGMDNEGSRQEIGARTGCVGCNLASQDVALDRVIARAKWSYLAPLKRLKPIYAELKLPHNRLRKFEEQKQDGSPSGNPFRMGPLTMKAREWALSEILKIQDEVNAGACRMGEPEYWLIDEEELSVIRTMIAANTWPQRWDGTEITGDALISVDGGMVEITRQGGRQAVMTV